MSIKLTANRTTALVAALCLMASLTVTSCGKKDKPAAETPNAAQTAGEAVGGAANTVGGAATGAANTVGGAATGAAAGIGAALNPADKTKLAPVKTALVMTNSAVKNGDMTKAKAQFDKFNGMWKTVEPMVKASAGDNYKGIESGLAMATTAMGAKDKVKAGEGLTTAIKALGAVIDKK